MRFVIPTVVVVALTRINEVLWRLDNPDLRFITPRRVNLRETKGEPTALGGPGHRSTSTSTFRVDICGPGVVAQVMVSRSTDWEGEGKARRLAHIEDLVTSIRLRFADCEVLIEGAEQISDTIIGRYVPKMRPRAVANQSS